MNDYSITSDSRRWWWVPATAGAIGAAAVTAIFVVPATGTAPSYDPPVNRVGGAGTGTVVERPCYLARRDWNTVRGWEQPVCTTRVRGVHDDVVPHVRRPADDYLP